MFRPSPFSCVFDNISTGPVKPVEAGTLHVEFDLKNEA